MDNIQQEWKDEWLQSDTEGKTLNKTVPYRFRTHSEKQQPR